MKTKKQKKSFPFRLPRPRNMLVLEQVLCMVWLADNKTLQELRQGQSNIEQQQHMARENNCSESTRADLGAMADNYAAAVAYQTFTEDDFWLAFINN